MAFSNYGVDTSVLTTQDQFKCLIMTANTSFVIIRAYRSLGAVDDAAPESAKNAHAAGIFNIGAYIFPCIASSNYSITHNITCESPSKQFQDTIDFLESNGLFIFRQNENQSIKLNKKVVINRVWLDVEDEQPNIYYDVNSTINDLFLTEMVSEAHKQGIQIGIYTTKTYWSQIMNDTTSFSAYPLWYPRYDAVNSMDFFSAFGGWNDVKVKQTGGSVGLCEISQVDTDYMEWL